jgi:hypothetical protein
MWAVLLLSRCVDPDITFSDFGWALMTPGDTLPSIVPFQSVEKMMTLMQKAKKQQTTGNL